MRQTQAALVCVMAFAVLAAGRSGMPAWAGEATNSPAPAESESHNPQTTIGIEGTYFARYHGPLLEAAPFDENAPIVLRIAEVTQDTSAGGKASTIYELRYIGTRPGVFDLREYLVRRDGKPIAGLEPLSVEVMELLPPDHTGELAEYDLAALPTAWPYSLMLRIFAVLWLIPIAWVVLKFLQRRRPQAAQPTPELTLADQLRPLVEAAMAGQMNRVDKARLERLLLGFWRERLDLSGLEINDALNRMRQHPQAGVLLRELEVWLHEPPGRAKVNVSALLAPYQHASPQDLFDLPRVTPPQTAEVAT